MPGASSQHKQTGLVWWHQTDSLETRGRGLQSAPGFGFQLHDFRSPTGVWSALTQPKPGVSHGHQAKPQALSSLAARWREQGWMVPAPWALHCNIQALVPPSKGSRLAKACQKCFDLCRNAHWNVFNGFVEKKILINSISNCYLVSYTKNFKTILPNWFSQKHQSQMIISKIPEKTVHSGLPSLRLSSWTHDVSSDSTSR